MARLAGRARIRDADDLADGIRVGAEELIANDASNHGHLGGGSDILRREERPQSGRPRSDERKIDIRALDLRVPVLVARDQLSARVDASRQVLDAIDSLNRRSIVGCERAGIPLALSNTAL